MIFFEIITLFPNFFSSPLKESILSRAQEKDLIKVRAHNIRNYTKDKHHITDDYAYGGGVGMILKPEPIVEALEKTKNIHNHSQSILLTPQGKPFSQNVAEELINYKQIILVCGRYEGVDERIRHFVDQEISIGDYILSGGETAALVIIEAVSRLIPGVLGKYESTSEDSFTTGLIEYPQYTRPRDFRGYLVPEVLLSGHHQEIKRWRLRESLKKTFLGRPDLLEAKKLSSEEMDLLKDIKQELIRLQGNTP
ncbi:MAG: tRNA (guanosine(37)-N1)-methyltransferase TrmD [Deltaproteobacteria bacterium]|nr:tRNA (guanosine(37)-N1)-methyltransferase TrmD [Deltaproteobacteria bacterium]